MEKIVENKKKKNKFVGVIYILTNPSFPEYIKIGYASDIEQRLIKLNKSECIPFAFRLYAFYGVTTRFTDMKLHSMIDKINPNLRAIDNFNNKKRVREFYNMKVEDAYAILEAIAAINGFKENLIIVNQEGKIPVKNKKISNKSDNKKQIINDNNKINNNKQIRNRKNRINLPKMDWLIEQNIVKIGDEIFEIHHPEELAIIVDKENVKYKGNIMRFWQFGCKVTGRVSICCYKYMKIKGNNELLSTLRERRMRELGMIK